MVATKEGKKELIKFLVNRWRGIAQLAALERVYFATIENAKNNNLAIPTAPIIIQFMPCRQIEVIKHRIIDILPEAKFIDYTYEAQAALTPDDFLEMYVADNYQCIGKVEKILNRNCF